MEIDYSKFDNIRNYKDPVIVVNRKTFHDNEYVLSNMQEKTGLDIKISNLCPDDVFFVMENETIKKLSFLHYPF